MLAIGRDDVVFVVECGDRADRDRFFARIEMAEAGDLAARVHLGGLLLEAPDQNHPPVEVQQLTFVHRQQGPFGDVFVTFQGHRKNPRRPRGALFD